jgi:hypothetical protein
MVEFQLILTPRPDSFGAESIRIRLIHGEKFMRKAGPRYEKWQSV